MDTSETTAARIRAAIREAWEAAGLTQTQVADAARIPRSTFDRHMDGVGSRTIDLNEFERIAAVLGTTVHDITAKAEVA
jgi:8-oxo-dGTP pyrophosphatase MutT (NUDIX family)